MQVIKIFDVADFEQSVILDNKIFNLRCKYNTRDENWYLSVHDKDLKPLFLNRRISIGFTNMFSSVPEDERPGGYLFAYAKEGVEKITRNNFGSDVLLIFAGYDEIQK